jgi:hypothetical protein
VNDSHDEATLDARLREWALTERVRTDSIITRFIAGVVITFSIMAFLLAWQIILVRQSAVAEKAYQDGIAVQIASNAALVAKNETSLCQYTKAVTSAIVANELNLAKINSTPVSGGNKPSGVGELETLGLQRASTLKSLADKINALKLPKCDGIQPPVPVRKVGTE